MPTKRSKRKSRTRSTLEADSSTQNEQQEQQPSHTVNNTPNRLSSEDRMLIDSAGREPVSEWVKDAIRVVAEAQDEDTMNNFFMRGENREKVEGILQEMNENIRRANSERGVDTETGTIPLHQYGATCQAWFLKVNEYDTKRQRRKLRTAFNQAHDILEKFNKIHGLPEGWNVSASELDRLIEELKDDPSDSESETRANEPEPLFDDESDSESDQESVDSEDRTELDLLEARAKKAGSMSSRVKVLYWWVKGQWGTQAFVRYGSKKNPVYRIRAGLSFDRKEARQILPSHARGPRKNPAVEGADGVKREKWTYNREHVADILGVGWKVKDDDEEEYEPLSGIYPNPNIVYPETRVLVRWKDGRKTLETRTFIRRIIRGSNLNADRVIYHKAKEMEEKFEEMEFMSEDDESVNAADNDEEAEADITPAPVRTTASPAVRLPARVATQAPLRAASIRPATPKPRNPVVVPPPQAVTEDPRDLEIRELRERLERLNNQSQMETKYSQFRGPHRRAMSRYDDDGASSVSSKPPLAPLRPRRRRGYNEPFNRWD